MNKIDTEPTYRVLFSDRETIHIDLVGVGGTGSALAIDLARLAYHAREKGIDVKLRLIDHDCVEPKNVGRQQFSEFEIGRNKAETMAARLNYWLGLEVAAVPHRFTADIDSPYGPRIVIGAVDNPAARREIHGHCFNSPAWWIDAGNGEFGGQVLIGNERETTIYIEPLRIVDGLPLPSLQAPALLEDEPEVEQELDCALRMVQDEQSLNVNRMMAVYAAQAVYDIVIRGELAWMSAAVSLNPPSASSRPIKLSTLEKYVEVTDET